MGCSAVDVGLTGLFSIESESVGGVGRGVVGVFNSPKGFLLQNIKIVERLM